MTPPRHRRLVSLKLPRADAGDLPFLARKDHRI